MKKDTSSSSEGEESDGSYCCENLAYQDTEEEFEPGDVTMDTQQEGLEFKPLAKIEEEVQVELLKKI